MIAVITDPAIGGSFLSWTIHYLSGKDKSFSIAADDWIDLPANPIVKTNAHGFDTNQVINLPLAQKTVEKLSALDDKTQTAYAHPFIFVPNENRQGLGLLCSSADKLIFLTVNPKYKLYYISYYARGNHRPSLLNRSILVKPGDEMFNDIIEYHYSDSKKQWGEQNLIEIWDRREFMALSVKLIDPMYLAPYINLDIPHYRIDSLDLMTSFENNLKSLFRYLELDIVDQRYRNWLEVYAQWKKLHINRLRYAYYYDIVLDYIIKGRDFDLTHLDLDIYQEAVIQRGLMYRHNLNLKTWGLEKFLNTKQLHDLLEPCHHDINNDTFKNWCKEHL